MDLEELLKEKLSLERMIEQKVNEFQDKHNINLKVLIFDSSDRLIGNDYYYKKCELKVEL